MDMDVDMDDAVPFSQEDWTNGEEEDMEWDAAVLEAALHELDHLRRGPVPEGSNATPRPTHARSLLDTNDAGLFLADARARLVPRARDSRKPYGTRAVFHVTLGPDRKVVTLRTSTGCLRKNQSLQVPRELNVEAPLLRRRHLPDLDPPLTP